VALELTGTEAETETETETERRIEAEREIERGIGVEREAGTGTGGASSAEEGSLQSPTSNLLPHCRPKVDFPFLTFLASGGHTSLLLCHDLGA
jgi:hypothetical protein